MTPKTSCATLFAEERAGATFILWLCAGMVAATGLGTLLPWPPDTSGAAMFVVVFAICATIAWKVGRARQVQIDSATRSVIEQIGLGNLRRRRKWDFSDFANVEVTQLTIKVARRNVGVRRGFGSDHETHHRYLLTLRGDAAATRLTAYGDVLEAEAMAAKVAGVGGWTAKRRGYTIEVSHDVTDALQHTKVKIHTAEGAQGIIAL